MRSFFLSSRSSIKRYRILLKLSLSIAYRKSLNYLAFEIFDEKRSISSPPTAVRASKSDSSSHNRSKSTNHVQDESSISEENSIHRKETDL